MNSFVTRGSIENYAKLAGNNRLVRSIPIYSPKLSRVELTVKLFIKFCGVKISLSQVTSLSWVFVIKEASLWTTYSCHHGLFQVGIGPR